MKFDPKAKMLWHGERFKKWAETGRTMPVLMEVSPTGHCNAKCDWCFFKDQHTSKNVDTKIMLRAIEDMGAVGVKAINWTGGGEPTLHPDFDEFVSFANSLGIEQGLFTNGYREIPFQNCFSWIRISLTNAGFSKIIKPQVPFGICLNQVFSHTKDDIEAFCLAAKNFGAAYFQIRPALVGNYTIQPTLSAPTYLNKYETEDFKVNTTSYKYAKATKPKSYSVCYGYHFCLSIDWEGRVLPCLYLAGEKGFVLGDLKKSKLPGIISTMKKAIKVTPICQNCCKNNEINEILYEAKDLTRVNFL